jgi:hypothetical protein
MDKANELGGPWRGAIIKAKNVEMMFATNGKYLRIRHPDMKPVEVKLVECGEGADDKANTAVLEWDVDWKEPSATVSPLPKRNWFQRFLRWFNNQLTP